MEIRRTTLLPTRFYCSESEMNIILLIHFKQNPSSEVGNFQCESVRLCCCFSLLVIGNMKSEIRSYFWCTPESLIKIRFLFAAEICLPRFRMWGLSERSKGTLKSTYKSVIKYSLCLSTCFPQFMGHVLQQRHEDWNINICTYEIEKELLFPNFYCDFTQLNCGSIAVIL
jgi:hypothetical protein